jgi:hypothetical protein
MFIKTSERNKVTHSPTIDAELDRLDAQVRYEWDLFR